MSNSNRNQRRGLTISDGTALSGTLGELFGNIGAAPRTASTSTAQLEYMYTRILFRMSMSRFTWSGLPASVSRRWLEMCLATQGLAVFFRDPDTDQFFATQGSPAGNYNMVGDPTSFRATAANNMKWWEFDVDHCVPIWANEMRTPDMDIIRLGAHDLAETHRTVQINLKNARQTKMLAFPQNSALTVEQVNQQFEAGSNAIKVEAEFGSELETMFQVLDLGVNPDMILNVSIMKTRIWGDYMTLLGINNAPNQDKKERLVSAEVSGNDDMIESIRETNLEPRQVACDAINRMFPEIAALPENQPEQYDDTDPVKAETLRAHPGLWVEYATDMNQTAMKDVGQDSIEGGKSEGGDE